MGITYNTFTTHSKKHFIKIYENFLEDPSNFFLSFTGLILFYVLNLNLFSICCELFTPQAYKLVSVVQKRIPKISQTSKMHLSLFKLGKAI